MLFNSYEFIFAFLPGVFLLYFLFIQKGWLREGKIVLLISSLFFYSWWNIIYLPLILFSMLFNFSIGNLVSNGKKTGASKKRYILIFGIIINLTLLGYFKYYDFFFTNINNLFQAEFNLLHLALPLAISFFTFQQIAYIVDSYSGKIKKYNFLNYGLFVTFFPQLIAGPIVHHRKMMPQFDNSKNSTINYENIAKGIFIFAIGLFKKVVIADTFATWANFGFTSPYSLNLIEAWVASLSFGFQLYFDFSGYADMAIGIALFFNIKLPVNFLSPYKAANIQMFWQRWHITLSHFLRDYISLPLKKKKISLRSNILLTFLVSGIWHGAGWTFIIWGLLHGMALVIHDIWKNLGLKMHIALAWLITFNFLNMTRIFFRADSTSDALHILKIMIFGEIILPLSFASNLGFLQEYGIIFGKSFEHLHTDKMSLIALLLSFLLVLLFKNSIELTKEMIPNKRNVAFTASLLFISYYYHYYLDKESSTFYYFIF